MVHEGQQGGRGRGVPGVPQPGVQQPGQHGAPVNHGNPAPPQGQNVDQAGAGAAVDQQLQGQQQAPMMAVDFQTYMNMEKKERQEANTANQNSRRETEERQKAEAQIKRVPKCDGATTHAVRDWLREVDLTIPYSGCTVYIAAQSATGPLRREIEHFLNRQPDRNRVLWAQVRKHVQDAFLSPLEADRLRDEVEALTQGAYEASAAFGRRFREAADLAYPEDPQNPRNQDQKRILLKSYLRGLLDKEVVSRVINEANPDTFEEAMDWVVKFEADAYRRHQALGSVNVFQSHPVERHEEPMEVNAMYKPPIPPTNHTDPVMAREMSDVKRQMSGLAEQFTKLMATFLKDREERSAQDTTPLPRSHRPRASNNSSARRAHTGYAESGSPICNFCGRAGHVYKQCRKRQRQMDRQNDSDNQGQGGL